MSKPESETARRALAIAAAIAAADPGDKAETRRMGNAGSGLFWRQVARLDIPEGQEVNWRLFTRLVALLTPASRAASIHDAGRAFGAALADAGLSEARLARLLAARGTARHDALERAIRMLARMGGGLDVTDLARTILWPDDTSRLARSYYHQLDHVKDEDTQNAQCAFPASPFSGTLHRCAAEPR
jgi:CRISPR system Cascade subunit CasB